MSANTTPQVSIVVATYNYGHYIAQALESICAQTVTDWDVLIVDDGSSDNTVEQVQPFLADPRFRYEVIDHKGQPAAKNHGIRGTSGELIAFLDADDIWMPTKLERQLELFTNNPQLGVAYSRRSTIGPNGEEGTVVATPFHRGHVLAKMFRTNFICFSSSMVRRKVFDEVGLFNEKIPLAIDYELWLRVACNYCFDYVDDSLVKYRTGHANLSQRSEERLYIALDIMRMFLATEPDPRSLPRSVVRRSFAETYCNLGYLKRDRSTLKAMGAYLRALTYLPICRPAWKGLVVASIPARLRHFLRTMRPASTELPNTLSTSKSVS